MYLRWRPSSSHVSRPYVYLCFPHWGPSKESLSLLYKAFLWLFRTYASPGWFPFLSATNITKLERLHRAVSHAITGCLSSSLSHFFSPRLLYLPYESPWLISLFYLISGPFVSQPPFLFQVWPDLEWNQDFADRSAERLHPLTRSCFLVLLLGRLFLLALHFLLGICLRSRWSPLFPLHASAPIPLSFAKVWLSPTLTFSSLMICYSGLMALFLFLLARAAPAYLPTALSVALRPLFPFRQAQCVQVFPLKLAPFCTLFAGLGSTNKSAISLLLLPDSRSVLATLSSPPFFLLPETLWQELSSLSCSIMLQWLPRHSFFPGNDAADELASRGALLAPSAIPCSLSPLISRIYYFFSD